MYEIVNVIYGVVISDEIRARLIKADPDEETGEMTVEEIQYGTKYSSIHEYDVQMAGFETDYHGNAGSQPAYFGVELDSWGCHETQPFVNWEAKLTDEHKEAFDKRVEKWSADIPDLRDALGKPGIYYYGSSS